MRTEAEAKMSPMEPSILSHTAARDSLTVVPITPVGFLVISKDAVYGVPIDEEYAALERKGAFKPQSFGLEPVQLEVVRIEPRFYQDGKVVDMIGIVTTFEGPPLPKGAIANRIGDFIDVADVGMVTAERL